MEDKIETILASLADSYRHVLELVLEGRSVKEIASVTGGTQKAIWRRLAKARAEARRRLSPCGDTCALDQRCPEKCPYGKENLFCDKLRQWQRLHSE